MNPNLAIAETRQQFLPLPVILRPREREKVPTQEADEGRRDKNHSCGEGRGEGELYSNFGVQVSHSWLISPSVKSISNFFYQLTLPKNAWLNQHVTNRTNETTIITRKYVMKINFFAAIGFGLAVAATLMVAGCDSLSSERTQHRNTSLYSYLYSNKNGHVDAPTVPTLSLPLRVGIAFVPADTGSRRNYDYDSLDQAAISESQKMALMKQISADFKKYSFVKSIDLIPTTYLTPNGGFANLDQIRTMYDVDVVVLLSYDQAQFTGRDALSISYWTIVGAYVVPGENNETRTMLDAAVYDINSRKLLFRAPGIGDVKHSATPINLTEVLHQDSQAGLQIAATNLTANLQVALEDFRERVTNSIALSKQMGTNAPAEYRVAYKPGYTGSGALGKTETTLLAGLAICFLFTLHNSKKRKV
jgi:rhombotail lipoprotein